MKKLTQTLLLLACSVGAMAQVNFVKQMPDNYEVMPPELTDAGKAFICVYNESKNGSSTGDRSVSFDIYNDDMEKVTSFAVPVKGYEEKLEVFDRDMNVLLMETDTMYTEDIGSLEDAMDRYDVDSVYTADGVSYLYTYDTNDWFEVETYGYKYPCAYRVYENGKLSRVKAYYKESPADTYTRPAGTNISTLYVYPQILGSATLDIDATVTQTLFNKDDNYEYVIGDVEPQQIDVKNEDNRRVGTQYFFKGFKVVSDNGKEVASAGFPADENGYYCHDFDCDILDLNGKKYMVVTCTYMNGSKTTNFYRIDASTQTIRQVGQPVRSSVSPTVAGRNELVTVALDAAAEAPRTVTVTDAAGRTVFQTVIPAGRKSVRVSASRFGQGMNVVSVQGHNAGAERTKVFVK